MKKILLAIGILTLVGFGGWWVFVRDDVQIPKNTNQVTQTTDLTEGGKYLVIKEWGVKFELPEELRGDIDYIQPKLQEQTLENIVTLYSKKLEQDDKTACQRTNTPLGIQLRRSKTIKTGDVVGETDGFDRNSFVKLGDFYFNIELGNTNSNPWCNEQAKLIATNLFEIIRKDLSLAKPSAAAQPAFLEIKEWGIKFEIPDKFVDDMEYRLTSVAENGTQSAHFSVKSLSAIHPTCGLEKTRDYEEIGDGIGVYLLRNTDKTVLDTPPNEYVASVNGLHFASSRASFSCLTEYDKPTSQRVSLAMRALFSSFKNITPSTE